MIPTPVYQDDAVTIYHGECLNVLRDLAADSIDAVVTDPPYGLGFMGHEWDQPGRYAATRSNGVPAATQREAAYDHHTTTLRQGAMAAGRYDLSRPSNVLFGEWCQEWATECLRVLKPGGHLVAFGGSRTWHRLAAAVEDAGFEIRDSIAWLYGSGFPKSLDVAKAIDKASRGVPQGGSDPTSPNHGRYRTTKTEGKRWDSDSGQSYGAGGSRFLTDGMATGSDTAPVESGDATASEWHGWGTALKPAFEPIVVGRKPLVGTVAANVLTHGTGVLNIDACRVGDRGEQEYTVTRWKPGATLNREGGTWKRDDPDAPTVSGTLPAGRWPTNVLLDDTTAAMLDAQSGERPAGGKVTGRQASRTGDSGIYGAYGAIENQPYGDSGGASRFFPTFRYQAKAPTSERPRGDDGTVHPTVKPLDLMRWLVRLVTPTGGLVLDPFLGSGTTAEACVIEHLRCIGIEREAKYIPLAIGRLTKPIQIGLDLNVEDTA